MSSPTQEWLEQKYITEGIDMVQIGKILGKDPKTVLGWMRKYGIPTRPRGSNRDKNLLNGRPAGYHHSPETIEKIRQDTIAKGKVPYLKHGKHWLSGKNCEDNPNWKGGITPERQEFTNSEDWKKIAFTVWQRDNATCQKCGKVYNRKTMKPFHVHHIVSFMIKELRLDTKNLILLCRPCHYWVHSLKNVNKEFIKEN